MTSFDWLLVLMMSGSFGYLGVLVWRKIPQLSIVDPMSSREAKSRERKNALLEARMMRQVQAQSRSVWKAWILPVLVAIQEGFQRIAGKLTAIERRYTERQRGTGTMDAAKVKTMIDEAKVAIVNERYDRAEETLIAVVSHDPKNVDAYETLGRMYLAQEKLPEAKESLEFLAKLAPKDPSVMVALGEVHDALGEKKEAFAWYQKGRDASPNNPKYLDFFIESAIEVGEFYEAQQAIDHLKDVNPENAKIEEFEVRLAEARMK